MGVGNINVNNQHVSTVPFIENADKDFSIVDENNYAIVNFEDGHIKTKNFDSSNITETNFSDDVKEKLNLIGDSDYDFEITDEENYSIVRFENGHIKTKNFDSSNINQTIDCDEDFEISDENNYSIVKFSDGHIKTKNFDSSNIQQNKLTRKELVHFILLGQSLSVGYASKPVLPSIDVKNAYMFSHVRTFDVGYNLNVSRAIYNPTQETYDEQFYQIRQLKEESDFGYNANKWIGFSSNEGETVCSGIAEMLEKLYKEQGYDGIPFSSIFTAGGVGATIIEMFGDGQTGCFNGHSSDIYERFKKDVRHAMKYASELGFAYRPIMVWMQGEGSLTQPGFPDRTFEYCKQTYENLHTVYNNYLKSVGIKDDLQLFLYQTDACRYILNPNNALAQFDIALKKEWAHLTYPIYNLQKVTPNDYTHLTNISERLYGNCIGSVVFDYFNKSDVLFKITRVIKDNNTLYVHFNKQVTVDLVNMKNLNSGVYTERLITEITRTLGFFPVDANGDIALNTSEGIVVSGQVTLSNDNVIMINCSKTPVKLMYGYRDDNTEQISTTGGAIRIDDELIGYNNNNVYRYLPQQLIEVFEPIYEFSYIV